MNPEDAPERGGIEDTERVVLGSMLMSTDAAMDVADVLRGWHYASPRHELVHDAVLHLAGAALPHDPIAVASHLTETGDLARCGGAAYLHSLVASVAAPSSAGYYAGLVHEAAMKRRVRTVGARLELISGGDGAAIDVLNAARAELDAAVEDRSADLSVDDQISEALAALDEGPGTPTPWGCLTGLVGGWKPAQLYVAAARPGVGKSVFALAAMLDMARRGQPVAMFSLEMSRTELWLRMLSSVASVDGRRIQTRNLRASDRADLERAADQMRGLPLVIDDRTNLSVAQIQAKVRTLQRRAPLGLVVVDYLGLVKPPPGIAKNDRRVQVDAIAWGLKETAKTFEVPVLATAQLNRAIETRAGSAPQLSDLRESGGIEASADVVMLMHRATNPDPDAGVDPSELKVHIGKNRHGPQTVLELIFQGHYSRISEGPAWAREQDAS